MEEVVSEIEVQMVEIVVLTHSIAVEIAVLIPSQIVVMNPLIAVHTTVVIS